MDIVALIALIQALQGGVGTIMRMVERAQQAGEITPEQLQQVIAAAEVPASDVARIVAEAKARLAGVQP